MTADQMLFTEKDLEKSMDKIETVHFHEVTLIQLKLPLKYG
jgi:Cft2 family RNA processing exonuclease